MPRRYVLVTFLEDFRDGDEFLALSWPLHLTIVPNFSIGWDEAAIQERIRAALVHQSPVAVRAGQEELFGPRKTVPVTVLEPVPDLMSMHNGLLELLTKAGASFDHPEHVQRGYRPHVTVTSRRRLHPGDRTTVDSISIVDLQPRGNTELRTVLYTVGLPPGT